MSYCYVRSGGTGVQSQRGGDGGCIEGMHRDIALHHTQLRERFGARRILAARAFLLHISLAARR